MVAHAVGELMAYWNFKPSMGRVWSVLYLSRSALSAEDIALQTGLSTGSVSMTTKDLLRWRVIVREWDPASRKRLYRAETDILGMVTRVFRERESGWVRDLVSRLEEAARILDEEAGSSVPDEMMEGRFVATRVQNLLELSRTGLTLIEQFGAVGSLDLRRIRGSLKRRMSI